MATPPKTTEELLGSIFEVLDKEAKREELSDQKREAFEREQKTLIAQITAGKLLGELGSVFGGMKNLGTPGAVVGDVVQRGQERAKILLDLEKKSLSFGNSLEGFKNSNQKMSEFMQTFGTKFGAETGLEAIGAGIGTMKNIPTSVMDLGMQMKATGQSSEQLFLSMRALNVQGGLQQDKMDTLSKSMMESSVQYGISTEQLTESIMLLSDRMLDYGALGLTDEVADLMQAATAKFGAGSEKVIASFINQLTQPGNLENFARMGVSQADIDAIFNESIDTQKRLTMLSDLAGKMGDSFKETTEVFRSGAMGQFEAQNQAVGLTGEIGKTAIAFKGLQASQLKGMNNQDNLSEAIVNQKDIQTEIFNSMFDGLGKFINSIGAATQTFTYLISAGINLGYSFYQMTQFGKNLAPRPPPDSTSPPPTPTMGQAWKNIGKALIGRDKGGAINAGEPYITGENNPEVISTKTGGARVSVIDNNQLNSIMMKSMGAMMIVNSVQQLKGAFTDVAGEGNSIMDKVLIGITTLITVTQTAAMVKSMGGIGGMLGPLAGILPLLGPALPIILGLGAVGGLGYVAYNMYQDSKERRLAAEAAKKREEEEKRRIAQGETNRMMSSLSAEIKGSVLSQALGRNEQDIIIDLLKKNLDAAYKISDSGQKTARNTTRPPSPLNPNSNQLLSGAVS